MTLISLCHTNNEITVTMATFLTSLALSVLYADHSTPTNKLMITCYHRQNPSRLCSDPSHKTVHNNSLSIFFTSTMLITKIILPSAENTINNNKLMHQFRPSKEILSSHTILHKICQSALFFYAMYFIYF